ncbi:zinc-binding dehydrogenase [Actinomycetospora chiangmaiensis]|uniref:zinc-binding dehydrogenase n=1 Tax=Actinomycetospora chiangmaiensis TaxID=402650 RepID=UPI0003AB2D9F|nr:zinc-binding dehydrogenase [Actinomycetospora chiangmaiensis]
MRAWMLDGPGAPLRVAELDDPRPRTGGVVLEMLAVHVPAYTDVVAQAGPRGGVPTPLVLGVGGLGRVLAVGEDVFGIAVGEVVAHIGLLTSDDVVAPEDFLTGWTGIGGRGERTPTIAAMQQRWRDGTFAERVHAPAGAVVRLPGATGAPHEALLGWFAIAAEALDRAGLTAGHEVAVLGATGQLGTVGVHLALARGASRVVAVGRNPAQLERLAALDPRVRPVPLVDREVTAAAIGEVDVVLDALGPTPSAEPTLAGLDAVRPGGVIVLVGGVRQDLVIPYGVIMRRRLRLLGSWMFRRETLLRVWRQAAAGVLDLRAVPLHTVGLDDPAAALELAATTGGSGFVVLVPGGAATRASDRRQARGGPDRQPDADGSVAGLG